MALPLHKGFIDTVAAPRANADTVKLAPPAELRVSKNAADAENVEEGMVGVMQELRLGVVQRNQALQEQLDVILSRRDVAHSRLVDVIIPERESSMKKQRNDLASALSSLEAEMTSTIETWRSTHAASLIPISERLDRDVARETSFYDQELPAKNERQCGEAIRTMESEREALALDNATIRAREGKIIQRLEAHIARYRQRAADEVDDRKAQHTAYEAQYKASMEMWESSAIRAKKLMDMEIANLYQNIEAEVVLRKEGDALAVTSTKASMEKLRQEAISNFGEEVQEGKEGEDDEDDEDEDGKAPE